MLGRWAQGGHHEHSQAPSRRFSAGSCRQCHAIGRLLGRGVLIAGAMGAGVGSSFTLPPPSRLPSIRGHLDLGTAVPPYGRPARYEKTRAHADQSQDEPRACERARRTICSMVRSRRTVASWCRPPAFQTLIRKSTTSNPWPGEAAADFYARSARALSDGVARPLRRCGGDSAPLFYEDPVRPTCKRSTASFLLRMDRRQLAILLEEAGIDPKANGSSRKAPTVRACTAVSRSQGARRCDDCALPEWRAHRRHRTAIRCGCWCRATKAT